MKLIRGDDNDYKQWKDVCGQIIDLEAKLSAQLEIESYRNDLIDTLKELLISKEALIAEMRERNNK